MLPICVLACNAILGNEQGILDPDADDDRQGVDSPGGVASAGKDASAGRDGGAGRNGLEGGEGGRGGAPNSSEGGESGDGAEGGSEPLAGGKGGSGPSGGGKAGSSTAGSAGSGQPGTPALGSSCDPEVSASFCPTKASFRSCDPLTETYVDESCSDACAWRGFDTSLQCSLTRFGGLCRCDEPIDEWCMEGAIALTYFCYACPDCVQEGDDELFYESLYSLCWWGDPDIAPIVECYASGYATGTCSLECGGGL